MSQSTVQFVVAHCDEDLTWLEPCLDDCIIYSKGQQSPIGAIKLPNIGREGHTYLTHIINNYSKLADVTVFTQGQINDHCGLDILSMKQKALTLDKKDLLAFELLPARAGLECFDAWFGFNRQLLHPEIYGDGPSRAAKCRPGEYFAHFIGNGKIPHSIGWQPFAIFAVPREIILSRSLNFYKELQEAMFLGDNVCNNPETGHFMEKFWFAMWKPDEYVRWDESDVAELDRANQGQLAKGKWRINCKDECIIQTSPKSSISSDSGI